MATLDSLLRLPSTLLVDRDSQGRLLLRSNVTGTFQLWELEGSELRQLTDLPEPASGRYLPGARQVVVAVDEGGNERHQLFLLDLSSGELEPVVRDPRFLHRIAGLTRDGRQLAYLTNRRNGTDMDLYVRDLASGEERLVYREGGYCQPQGFSPDGRFLTLGRPGGGPMDTELVLVDAGGSGHRVLTPHAEPADVSEPAWLADSSGFYFSTNQGGDRLRLARYDLSSDRWEWAAPEAAWDVHCVICEDGSTLLVEANDDGWSRLFLHRVPDLAPIGEVPLARPGVAWQDERVPAPVMATDGSWTAYTLSGPDQPPAVYRFDQASGETALLAGEGPDPSLVAPQGARLTSFDGEQVPVHLYRPRSSGQGSPVVVSVHGGPESQARPVFDPVVQGLVARGYAVVAPNVRGSTGYGKRWYSLDDTVRRLDSVADLAAVHDWLGEAGLDPRRAAIWGASYGGYMVLAAVSTQPERWAAGVDIVGISDLVTFLEGTSGYRRALREREYGSLDRDQEFLHAASPLTHVASIRAPLFIIHGANDPRVPASEAEQIAASLKSRGIDHELLIYPDEGHGLARLANRLDAYPRAVDFLDRVLGEQAAGSRASAPAAGGG
jgi:protease II